MGVYRRGVTYWIRYRDADGVLIRESTKTNNKKHAELLLTKRRTEVFEGRFDINDVKKSPYFSDAMDDYLKNVSQHLQPSSHRRNAVSAKNLKAFFGSKRLGEILPMFIRHYRTQRLEAGRSKATVNRELALMKHLYTIANGKTGKNPVREVTFYKEKPRERVLSASNRWSIRRSHTGNCRFIRQDGELVMSSMMPIPPKTYGTRLCQVR